MPDFTNKSKNETALQTLIDAGDDVFKLIQAVKNASFLEDHPSPERQALRATKRKLKRALAKHNAAKKSLFEDNGDHQKAEEAFLKTTKDFENLCAKYESLRWRLVKMPGGATRKADAYYTLHGLMKQAFHGDVAEDCPMFAENGNIDFHGRFLWDAWNLVKGLSNDEAKAKFVREFFSFPASSLYKDTRENLLSAGPGGVQAAY